MTNPQSDGHRNDHAQGKPKPKAKGSVRESISNVLAKKVVLGSMVAIFSAVMCPVLFKWSDSPQYLYLPALALCLIFMLLVHAYVVGHTQTIPPTTEPSPAPALVLVPPLFGLDFGPKVTGQFGASIGPLRASSVATGGRFIALKPDAEGNTPTYPLIADGDDPEANGVRLARGLLVVNAIVSDLQQRAVISDNSISLPEGWDENLDQSCVELVNDKQQPVFQMRLYPIGEAFSVYLSGVFVSPRGKVWIAGTSTSREADAKSPHEAMSRITRIFKYPARQFPSIREDGVSLGPGAVPIPGGGPPPVAPGQEGLGPATSNPATQP